MTKRGIMKKRTKRYFPNNLRAVQQTEDELFPSMPFDVFYVQYVRNWLLPSSHECLIRATSLKTGKVKEYSYKYRKAAENKIKQLVNTHEFVVCDHDSIHKLSPHPSRYNNEETNTRD